MAEVFLTNIKGNIPTRKVIVNDIRRAAKALSLPLNTETRMDRNMKSALTRSAYPTFLVMALKFMGSVLCTLSERGKALAQLLVLHSKLGDPRVQFSELVIAVE